MKSIISILAIFCFFLTNAQDLRPYILGVSASLSISDLEPDVRKVLTESNFIIVGSYTPASDDNRLVLTVTHPALQKAVQKVGGLTGFAAVLRVGLTKESAVTNVTYTNPYYWGNAYFREEFAQVKPNYDEIDNSFNNAMLKLDSFKGSSFGSESGISIEDLQDYQYMFAMPDFDDTNLIGEFENYAQAIKRIDTNLENGIPDVNLVYKVEIPGKNLSLYGVALSGENGESGFLPIIDMSTPKHTAFLPYEILVIDNEVHMLHGRFRIALSFPDLTMGTFTKIMSTPGDIEDLMKTIIE